MKIRRWIIAITLVCLPVIARILWYYQGFYIPSKSVREPDYEQITIPLPEISTPYALEQAYLESPRTVLFDLSHRNGFSATEIETFINAFLQQNAKIDFLEEDEYLEEELINADAFIIIAPIDPFAEQDISTLVDFVERGGRLLVIADPTRSYTENQADRAESVEIANAIVAPFQIAFRNDYLYSQVRNEGNFRNIYLGAAENAALTKDVEEVVFYASRSIAVDENILIRGNDDVLSSLTDQGGSLAAGALSANGNVLVLGDVTFMTAPYYQVADNYQFMVNIAEYLLGASRTRTFADFPALFSNQVGILLTNGLDLDQEMISALSDLDAALERQGLQSNIVETEVEGIDLVILGIYPPKDDLLAFLESFQINFNYSENNSQATDAPALTATVAEGTGTPAPTVNATPTPTPRSDILGDYFYVPGIGKVPAEGFGFFLLDTQAERTVLVLLADSQENLQDLMRLIVRGSLSGCLMQDKYALCEQDTLADSRWDDFQYGEISEEGIETITPTPEETPQPTPAG